MSDNKNIKKSLKKKPIGPVGIVLIVIGILAVCGVIIFVVISTKPCPSGTTSHRFDNGMRKCVKPCNGTLFLDSKNNPQCCIPPKQIWEDDKGNKTCDLCQPGQTEVFEIPGDDSSDSACIDACDPNTLKRCPPALDYDNILSEDLKKDFPFLTNKLNLENPEDNTSVTCIPKNAKCLISSSGGTSTCDDTACGQLKDKNGNSLEIFTQCCGSPSSSVLDCPNCLKLEDNPDIKKFSKCGKSLSSSDYVSQCFGCPTGEEICPVGSGTCCTKPETLPCSSPNCCSAPSCCVTNQDESGGTSICCPSEHIRKNPDYTPGTSTQPELICCPDESWLAPTPSEPGICCPESHPTAIQKDRTCGKYCGSSGNQKTNVCYTSDGSRESPTTYCKPETVTENCQSPGAQCKPLICKTGSQKGKPPEFCFESSSGGVCMTDQCNATVYSNSPGASSPSYSGGANGSSTASPGTKPVAPSPSGDIWGQGCLKINNLTVFPEFEIQNPSPGVKNAYPLCAYYDSKTTSNTDTNPNIACGLDPKSPEASNYFRKLNFDITPDTKLLQNMGYNGTQDQQNALNDVLKKACLEMAENTNAVKTSGTVKYNEYKLATKKTNVGNYYNVPVGECQINWFCGEAINNKKWSGIDNSQVSAPCEENQLYKALDKTISDYKTKNKVSYPYWYPNWECNQKDTGTNSFMNSPYINDKMTSVDSCNPWNPTTGKCQLKGCESTSNINLYPSVIKQDSSGAGNICALSIDGTNESTGELPVVGPVIPYSKYDTQNKDYNSGLTCASKFDPDITPKTGSTNCRYQPQGYINFPYTYVDQGTENCSTESCTGGVTKENFSNPAGVCDPNSSRTQGTASPFEKIFNPCSASDTVNDPCTICSDNVGEEFDNQICTQNVQLCPYLQPDLFKSQGSTISMENLTKSLIELIQEVDTTKTTDLNAINSNWYLPLKVPPKMTKTVNLYPVVYKDYVPGNDNWNFTPNKYIPYDHTKHTLEYLKYDNETKQVSWTSTENIGLNDIIPQCYGLRWFPSGQSAWAESTSTIELIPEICNTWNIGKTSPFTGCIRLMHQKAKNSGKGTIIGPPISNNDEYSQRIGCIECQSANSDCGGSPNSSYKGACYNNKQTGVLNCKQCNNPKAPKTKFDTNWIPNYIDSTLQNCVPCPAPSPNFYYDPNDNPPGLVGKNACKKSIIPPKPDFVNVTGLGCAWVGKDYESRVGKIGYGDFSFTDPGATPNYAICQPCSAQDNSGPRVRGIVGKGGTGDDNSMDNCYYWQPTKVVFDKTGSPQFSPIISPSANEACKALHSAVEDDLKNSKNPYINNKTRGLACTCKNWYADLTKNTKGTIYDSNDLTGVYGCSNLMDYNGDNTQPTSNVCQIDKKTAQIDYGCYKLGTLIDDSPYGQSAEPGVSTDTSIGGTYDFLNWKSTDCYMDDNPTSCFPCGAPGTHFYGLVKTGVQGGISGKFSALNTLNQLTGINNKGTDNTKQESCACFANPNQSGGIDCCLEPDGTSCTGNSGDKPFNTGKYCLTSNQPKLSHIQTDTTKCATKSLTPLSFGKENNFWNSGKGSPVGDWPPQN